MSNINIDLNDVVKGHKAVARQLAVIKNSSCPDFFQMFIGSIKTLDGSFDFIGECAGDTDIGLQSLMFAIEHSPKDFKKIFFVACANAMSEYNPELAFKVGAWIEKEFGHISCDCPDCKASNN